MHPLDDQLVTSPAFFEQVVASYAAAQPYMRFLCGALDLPF